MINRPDFTPKIKHTTLDESLTSKKLLLLGCLCLLIASSILLIASRSSPLYPFNDWADTNTFFTMGKGMMHGRVPYRDLFDHKGPLLYFIYGIAHLLSPRSFLGVYILESVSFSVFLFLGERTLSLFVRRKYALLTLPILAASILNLRSFAYGGTAESFTFPFLMAGLYYLIYYFKEKYPHPPDPKQAFFQGMIAGCVLWIKYSFLGFWLGLMAIIIATGLINKHFLRILKFCGLFLAGMIFATLPWIIYFGINGAISDWFQGYFVINLTAYAGDLSFLKILQTAIDSYQRHLQINPLAIGLLTLGILLFSTLRQYFKSWWFSLSLLLSIGLLALGVYAGGRDYIYYFLIFAPYLIFGFIHLSKLYQNNFGEIRSNLLFVILFITSLLFSFAYTFRFNRNTGFLQTNREELVQFKFAEIINQSDDPSLLNYGFQDGGFYTTTGIVPNVKYYQKFNFDYGHFPINMDEQNRYIKEERIEYVVIRYLAEEGPTGLNMVELQTRYRRIAEESQHFGEQEFTYALFKSKGPKDLSIQ